MNNGLLVIRGQEVREEGRGREGKESQIQGSGVSEGGEEQMDLQEQYVMSVSLACSHGVAWDKKKPKN